MDGDGSIAGHALPMAAETKGVGAPVVALHGANVAHWSPRNYRAFAREGMMQNAIVFRCVRLISEAAASIPLRLAHDAADDAEPTLLDLLNCPAPGVTATDLLEAWFGYLLVSGNAYLEATAIDGTLVGLHGLRPDRMHVRTGADGWANGYAYAIDGRSRDMSGDVVPGVRRVLHLKLFHPDDDHYGLSPIEAAASAIDIHNGASRWNKALLDNAARPSGALV